MLVYDVGNRDSFDALDSWVDEIKKDIGNTADFEGVTFAVCANKVRQKFCWWVITFFFFFWDNITEWIYLVCIKLP